MVQLNMILGEIVLLNKLDIKNKMPGWKTWTGIGLGVLALGTAGYFIFRKSAVDLPPAINLPVDTSSDPASSRPTRTPESTKTPGEFHSGVMNSFECTSRYGDLTLGKPTVSNDGTLVYAAKKPRSDVAYTCAVTTTGTRLENPQLSNGATGLEYTVDSSKLGETPSRFSFSVPDSETTLDVAVVTANGDRVRNFVSFLDRDPSSEIYAGRVPEFRSSGNVNTLRVGSEHHGW